MATRRESQELRSPSRFGHTEYLFFYRFVFQCKVTLSPFRILCHADPDQFQDLSEAVGGTKRELAEVEAQLQACVREQKRGVLTKGELDRVDDDAQMYQSVGNNAWKRAAR